MLQDRLGEDGTAAQGPARLYELLMSTNPLPMWVYDRETLGFLAVNDCAVDRYGYTRDNFLSMRITDIRPSGDVPVRVADLVRRQEGFERSGPWQHVLADGSTRWVDVTSYLIDWTGRPGVLVTVHDLDSAEPAGPHLPRGSELSGMASFAGLVEERLEPAARGRASVAVVLIGLDRLAGLEAASGVTASYAVVDEAHQRLVDCCGADAVVRRLGGSYFGFVCQCDDDGEVTARAGAALAALGRPFHLRGFGDITLPPAAGLRRASPGEDATDLIGDALVAMRAGAQRPNGKRLVEFEPHLREQAVSRFVTEQSLRQALAEDELELHYQPIIDLATRDVVSYEALLRWQRDGTFISPAGIIEVAEETGLIHEIGTWVRRKALTDLGRLRERRPDVNLAVNLSPLELAREDLASEIVELLDVARLDAASLCFEITETAIVSSSNDRGQYERLLELRDIGCGVAIDDFGTGYSVLSYLKYLPVDIVKIDRSFVSDLETNPADSVLVEAIARLGHALGLSVVAEGVETELEYAQLVDLGVDRGQGYLFGVPTPPAAL